MSSNSELAIIKSKLKTWEKDFKKSNGRDPNKSDIKANLEIAKLYSIYNTKKSNSNSSKPTSSTKNSSSTSIPIPISNSTHSSLNQSTPKKQKLEHKSNPTSYQHITSPIKLRQLLLSNSPRKHSNQKKSNSNRSDHSTPKLNPFESSSVGGKGSPDLFANLISSSEIVKDTPRTKARKYLIGVGSPFKSKPNRIGSNPSDSIHQGGLSTFLKSKTTDSSNLKPMNIKDEDQMRKDEDSDEILGPSPFKPTPSDQVSFKCLFDDQSDLNPSDQTPIKLNSIHKLTIKSSIPFIPNHSQSSIKTSSDFPGSAPLDLTKPKINSNRIPRGGKRKRMKGGEEDESFYQEIHPSDLDESLSTVQKLNQIQKKRTKVNSKNPIESKPNGIHSELKPLNRLSNRKTSIIRDQDESNSESEGFKKMPNLPFGASNQSSVITELETFTFNITDPHPTSTTPSILTDPLLSKSNSLKSTLDWKGKGKGKLKGSDSIPIQLESESKQIKVTGTQKVKVRAYKPVNESQMNKSRQMNIFEDDQGDLSESLIRDMNEEINLSEEEEIEKEEEDKKEEEVEEEDEWSVSEEILNLLSLNELTQHDRKILKREKARGECVRRVLEGESVKVVGKDSKWKSEVKNHQSDRSIQDHWKSKLMGSSDLKNQGQSLVDGKMNEDELSEEEEDDDEDDDDWEEDPEGWKEFHGNHGLLTDD
ncbi:hypothetical protein DFH28DRAFT_1016805, partial [Melampsora americana]